MSRFKTGATRFSSVRVRLDVRLLSRVDSARVAPVGSVRHGTLSQTFRWMLTIHGI
ncbi:hypothetical protein Hdeb2414_s0013g00408461 [Helianthus debilis subsp. tardiflorus]